MPQPCGFPDLRKCVDNKLTTNLQWKFSDQIDDVDVEMLRRDFITFREAMEYYGLNEKPVVACSEL